MTQNNPLPVLFLDIDDVLCLNDKYTGHDVLKAIQDRHECPANVFREVFSRRACDALKELHNALDRHIRYVISSTWREALDRNQLREVFRRGGLGFVASSLHEAWCTPLELYSGRRVDDIASWLDLYHRGEPFAIVDDTHSGWSLKPALTNPSHPFAGRVLLCEENVGLLHEHVPVLMAALHQPLGDLRPMGN